MDIIKQNFLDAQQTLNAFIENKHNFERIKQAAELMLNAINEHHKIISCGNGGSMSDAMHFAEELTGRFRNNRPSVAAIAISDPSHLSCVANDYGFDYVFSRFIESVGQPGDVLLAISTSGNSQNVLNAAAEAHKKGMKVVALTGKQGGKLAEACDVEIRVPHNGYADRVQEIHIKIIHSLIHYIEHKLFDE